MEGNYDIAVSGARTDKDNVKAITTENVNQTIAQREKIVRSIGVENPRQSLTFAVGEAKKHLVEIHQRAGINLNEKDIPEVIFIEEKRIQELKNKLAAYGGTSISNEKGSSSVWNGVTSIYLADDITDLDYASIILHEMFHSIGKQVIAANENVAAYGRQGYEIFGINSPYKPWLLEEGLVVYESAIFAEKLERNPLYQKDAALRKQKVDYLKQHGAMLEDRIKLDSGMEVEPKYFWLMQGQNIEETAFGLPENSGLAGSLFELLASRFVGEERTNFFNTVYAARKDLKLIPKLANLIDTRCGKGTYAKFLKCERTETAVCDFIQDLKKGEDLQLSFNPL